MEANSAEPGTRDWEVCTSSLLQVLQNMLDDGVPVFGTFNFDWSLGELLSKAKYKPVSLPSLVKLDGNAE